MSYMGPRFIGGGGQIFPQNQNQSFQPQHLQRQYQVMQMQMQLQHKIQMQKQQLDVKNSGLENSGNKGKTGSGSGQNQSNSNTNKPALNQRQQNVGPANSKPTPNQNTLDIKLPQDKKQNSIQPQVSSQSNPTEANQENRTSNTTQKKDKQETSTDSKGQNKSRFGNKAQDPQPHQQSAQSQQGSLMGQPPPLPSSQKQDIKNEQNQSPNKGRQNQSNFNHSNQHNSYEGQGKQNQYEGQGKQNQYEGQGKQNQYEGQGKQNQYEGQGKQNQYEGQGKQNQYEGQGRQNQYEGQGRQNQYEGQGRQNQYEGQGRQNQYEGQGRQNQYNSNRNFGKGQRNAQKNMAPYSQDRSGKGGTGDYRSNMMNRSGAQSSSHSGHKGSKNYYGTDKIKEKVLQLFNTPQTDLPPLDMNEKKFNNNARLFIGNIPKNCEQNEVVSLFEKFGEIGSVYLNKDSSFAFINFDFKANAAKALRDLDNTMLKNRYLKVRFATISEGIRVKNLSPYVSNELLERSFSVFGMIESCRVVVDDRGASKGEGIIIFRDKKAAVVAVKKCQEECYFLSGAMRPAVVTVLEPSEDNIEGLPETSLPKNDDYRTERQIGPHFAENGSFEFDFGVQWKQLFNMYDEKKSVLDRDFQIELERLEKKMVLAKVEYETEKLRKELAQREAETAELRRHFDFAGDNFGNTSIGASGAAVGNYDAYPGGKRPLDQGYEASFNGPYDQPYNDNYDRGGYPAGEYDRGAYDQSYGGYGREDYRREGAYGHEDHYDRPPYDHPKETPAERPLFEPTVDQGYANKPPDTPHSTEPYKAPNKRPRY